MSGQQPATSRRMGPTNHQMMMIILCRYRPIIMGL